MFSNAKWTIIAFTAVVKVSHETRYNFNHFTSVDPDLPLNSLTFNDFRPTSRYISQTVQDSAIGTLIGTRMRSIKWCHFQWPWTNSKPCFQGHIILWRWTPDKLLKTVTNFLASNFDKYDYDSSKWLQFWNGEYYSHVTALTGNYHFSQRRRQPSTSCYSCLSHCCLFRKRLA